MGLEGGAGHNNIECRTANGTRHTPSLNRKQTQAIGIVVAHFVMLDRAKTTAQYARI